MKKFLPFLFAFLLCAQAALAAITSLGTLGVANSTTSGNTLVRTLAADWEVGNIAVMAIAMNNVGTTDADHSEVASIADAGGNTWAKLCEFTNGQGGAAAGATTSLWFSKATTQVSATETITVTFSNTITSRALSIWEFSVDSGKTFQQSATCKTVVADGLDSGPADFSGLANLERLYFRAYGAESNSGTPIATHTTNYTGITQTRADTGSSGTSIVIDGEFRIVTATGDTNDPVTIEADSASVFVALEEANVAVPSTRRPIAPIIFP